MNRLLCLIVPALLSCDPPRDPARVYGSPAHACATRHVAPTDADTELALIVADQSQADFVLEGICVTLDGGAVMLTDTAEIAAGRVATRHVRVKSGAHTFDVRGLWRGREYDRYHFEVKSTHVVDAGATTVRATAYEHPNVPVQERLRIEWRDE